MKVIEDSLPTIFQKYPFYMKSYTFKEVIKRKENEGKSFYPFLFRDRLKKFASQVSDGH